MGKYIGAYCTALGGIDAIVFTAGIGENSPYIREKILENMKFLGIKISKGSNEKNKTVISSVNSKVKVFVIPTDEELVIAKDTFSIVSDIVL